jgi:hypothetical protein
MKDDILERLENFERLRTADELRNLPDDTVEEIQELRAERDRQKAT